MKNTAIAVIVLAFLGCADDSSARGSGSSHSGSSRSSSHSSSKNSHYVSRSCKTSACFKKHAGGTYGFMAGQKKK